ncbi:MAG TPA: hypothetical protein PKW88_01170, partial [Plasticicumulans sp.]|nr:hypothetical protein [Plasticicumulans sp.]HMZ09302.1 hypothetical protein [Plasticicumulans sp.]HNI24056.1 hypothetical protein [Plasticicumulans sp.]
SPSGCFRAASCFFERLQPLCIRSPLALLGPMIFQRLESMWMRTSMQWLDLRRISFADVVCVLSGIWEDF